MDFHADSKAGQVLVERAAVLSEHAAVAAAYKYEDIKRETVESSKGKDPHQQFLQVGAAHTKMMEEFKRIIFSFEMVVDNFYAITGVSCIISGRRMTAKISAGGERGGWGDGCCCWGAHWHWRTCGSV